MLSDALSMPPITPPVAVGLSALRHTVPDQAGGARAVPDVLEEFEGVFLSLLVKEMRKTISEDGLFGGDSTDSLGGIFDMYLGQHLGRSGGLGLARSLSQYAEMALAAQTPEGQGA